jgi:four helix bundle protein
MSNSYRDLIVWQKSLALVTDVYRITERFPKHEMFGLSSQLQRAAVSVVANIAEGQARNSKKEFVHFLSNSRGSLAELETEIYIASNLRYINEAAGRKALAATDEISRLINGLMNSLQRRLATVAGTGN